MRTMDSNPKASTLRSRPWPTVPTRGTRLGTTRPRCPSTPRGFRRTPRHPSSSCSPNPRRGQHAPQVGPFLHLFPLMEPEFWVCLLRWPVCPTGSGANSPLPGWSGSAYLSPPPLCVKAVGLGLASCGPLGASRLLRPSSPTNALVLAWPVPPRVVFLAGLL